MDDKFDGPLLGILQSCGELEPFLEVMLGFLYRKTDFYRPLSADQTMGFPEGVAKEKLLKVFGKFEKLASIAHSPPATHPPTPPATPGLLATSQQSSVSPKQQMVSPKQQMVSPKQQMVSPVPTPAPNVTAVAIKEEIQGDWSTCNWDHHNGGVTEQYAWSQTAQDVELKLALPNPSIKASDLKIDIKAHSIKVQMKEEADMKTVLEKKLHSSVKPEESMWSLLKGECIQVSLEKGRDGYWWTAMFEGDAEVDIKEIDTTRYVSEFPQEEQACVQKLMYDQQQKRQGLPTSDEQKTEDILRKAWNAEGSPFAGQEFDRSKINLSNSALPETFGT